MTVVTRTITVGGRVRVDRGTALESRRVRKVATDHLLALRHGYGGRVNRPLLAAMGELGLVRGLFGGAASELPQSAAAIQLCLLREALARVSGETETALALQGLGSYPIMQSSSPEQIERWLPRAVTGAAVAAFALSNRAPGQDALRLATSSTFTRWADGSPRQSSSIWRVR